MTAPNPRDTGPALDPRAVEAAAEALSVDLGDPGDWYEVAATALTAAAPFLRAEGADAVQAEVADLHVWDCDRFRTYDHGLRVGTCDCQDERAGIVAALRAEGAAAERQRIAAAIRAEAVVEALAREFWHYADDLGLPEDCKPDARLFLAEVAARIAEADPGTTAPTEGDDRD